LSTAYNSLHNPLVFLGEAENLIKWGY
jgi:hypothetical protein